MTTRTHLTEFPELGDLPEVQPLLAAGWTDQSWHNDAGAHFVSPCGSFELWVNDEDPAMRDCPESMDRFMLAPVQDDREDLTFASAFESATGQPFISTDDWNVITAALAELAAA